VIAAPRATELVPGRRWPYCRSLNAWVTWIGPARHPSGTEVPIHACAPCLEQLAAIAAQEVARMDAPRR
jgi:hypothetical protein